MSISFSGLASGLDTSSWVESLVALKKAKVTSLEEQKKEVQSLQQTLSQIKSFFSSFRSMLEKVTDAKLGAGSSMDLFAQNLATSSNLEALTAAATSEAEEATYNVKVDKLATETRANSNYSYMTTIVQTTTATADSKLINLGVKAGNIGVTVNGVKHGISITENDTISTFIEKLQNIGVKASYNEKTGIFSVDVSATAIDEGNTDIVKALHLGGVNEGYTSKDLTTTKTDTVYSAATESTKMSELGVKAGTVTIRANDKDYNITISNTTTLGNFIKALNDNKIEATLDKTGVFTISDATIKNEGGTGILKALGLAVDIYGKSQVTGNLKHETITTQTTTATTSTKLKELEGGSGIKDGQTVIVKNSNNKLTTITVATTSTLGDLLTGLTNAGLYAALKSDGTVEISGGTITGGTFKAEEVLGLEKEPYTAMVTGKPLTETVEVHKIVDLSTRLVDDLKVKEGYLEVTDANGDKYYEKIYSGQTIADFMTDMGNLGINTKLDDKTGVLTITGGSFKTLTDADVQALIADHKITETQDRYKKGTNLLECLYGSGTISTDHITVASTYSKTKALRHTVVDTVRATNETTLGKLGLTANGTAIFKVRGEDRTITVKTDTTIDGLITKLQEQGIAASWDEDNSRLTIENATLTGGTSNLANVLDLTTTVAGKYVTSSGLYAKETVAVDATRATTLDKYGIVNTMSVADRTLKIYDSEGNLKTSTVLTASTKIGDIVDLINKQDGITAVLNEGHLTISNGYIENATLEASMDLKTSNKSSYVLGNVKTVTTNAAVTGETTLKEIFDTIGTSSYVQSAYNLKFNDKTITVSATTTLNELINKIYENGGTASLDKTGRLSINGGVLTGTVAQALGMTSSTHTSSVSATGETLYTNTNQYADRNTTFKDLGIEDNKTYTVYNSLKEATTTVTVSNTTSIGSFLDSLKAHGIDGTISNGTIRLTSPNGTYIQGTLPTALGITDYTTTESINTNQQSTESLKQNVTKTADAQTTLGEIGGIKTGETGSNIIIYDKDQKAIGTITALTTSSTLQDMFDALSAYDIVGKIENGIISLTSPSGNYAAGKIMDNLGVGFTTDRNETFTVGQTTSSTLAITYTDSVYANRDTKLAEIAFTYAPNYGIEGFREDGTSLGTLTISSTSTITIGDLLDNVYNKFGVTGTIKDGVITWNSPNGVYLQDRVGNLDKIIKLDSTTTTAGNAASSTLKVTYTQTSFVERTTKLSDLGVNYLTSAVVSKTEAQAIAQGYTCVHNASELRTALSNSSSSAKVMLMNDIDMSGVSWTPISSFAGTFDGNGYTISNLNITSSEYKVGLIGTLSGSVENLRFENCTINALTTTDNTGSHDVGAGVVAGYVSGTIDNVSIVDSSVNAQVAGLVAGKVVIGRIKNSFASGTVTSNVNNSSVRAAVAGGIAGILQVGTIKNCGSVVTVSAGVGYTYSTFGAGGTVGNVYGAQASTIADSYTSANVNVNGTFNGYGVAGGAGAIIGNDSCYIENTRYDSVKCNKPTVAGAISGAIADANLNKYTPNDMLVIHDSTGKFVAKVDIDPTATVQDFFDAMSPYGISSTIKDGRIVLSSTNGNYITGKIADALGISVENATIETVTVPKASTSTATVTYTIDATENTRLGDMYTGNTAGRSLTINNADGTTYKTIRFVSNSTLGSIMASLTSEGFDVSYNNGVLSLSSADHKYVSGSLADFLGITTVTKTIGATATSTAAIQYTHTVAATGTTKLINTIYDLSKAGTITASGLTGTLFAISTAADLANLATCVNNGVSTYGKTFILTNDINLSGYSNWTSIAKDRNKRFQGTFDGCGYTISHLKQTVMAESTDNCLAGLFGNVGDAKIKNVKMQYCTIKAESTKDPKNAAVRAGFLIGLIQGNSTVNGIEITNCTGTANGNSNFGAVVGTSWGTATITDCKTSSTTINATVTTSGSYCAGIIASFEKGLISMCDSSVNFNGGLSGSNNGNYMTAKFGGIVSHLYIEGTTISDCIYSGTMATTRSSDVVTGDVMTGGILAEVVSSDTRKASVTMNNCIFAGQITNPQTIWSNPILAYTSGTYASATISNCFAYSSSGNTSGTALTSIAGCYSSTAPSFTNCYTDLNYAGIRTKVNSAGYSKSKWVLPTSGSILPTLKVTNDYSMYVDDNLYSFRADSTLNSIALSLPGGSLGQDQLYFNGSFSTTVSGGLASLLEFTRSSYGVDYYPYYSKNLEEKGKVDNIDTFVTMSNLVSGTNYITVVQSGTSRTITLTSDMTLGSLQSALTSAGITMSVSGGKITLTGTDRDYISGMSSRLQTAFKLANNGVYSTYTGNSNSSHLYEKHTLNANTTVGDLGIGSEQTIVINQSGKDKTITVSSTTTMESLCNTLGAYGVSASVKDGKLTIGNTNDESYVKTISSSLMNALKLKVGSGNTYTTSKVQHYQNTNSNQLSLTATVTMTTSSTFEELGFSSSTNGVTTVKNSSGQEFKITMHADSTVSDFIVALAGAGITASVRDGVFTVNANDNAFITSMDTNMRNALGIASGNLYTTDTTYFNKDSDTLTTGATFTAKTDTTFSTIGLSNKGYITVVSNGTEDVIEINPNQNIGDMLTALAGYGIAASIKDGKISIKGNSNAYVKGISNDLQNVLHLEAGQDKSWHTEVYKSYVNTNSGEKTFGKEESISGDAVLSTINSMSAGSLAIHKTDGTFVTISVDTSKTLDEFFEQIAQYGLVGSIDTNGVVNITGVGNVYLQAVPGGSNILTALKLGNVVTNVKTVTVNRTSNTLQHTVKSAASGASTLSDLIDSKGNSITFTSANETPLVLTTKSNAGNQNVTLTFSKTSTIYDVIDKLAEYGINASIDVNGKFTATSPTLTDFDIKGTLGEFLMTNSYTKNYGVDTTTNISSILQRKDVVNMDNSTKLSELGVKAGSANSNITINQEGVKYTVDVSALQTVGDFRNLLSKYGFNSYIDDKGRLNVIGVGNSTLENVSGGSNILDVFGLTNWSLGEITQQSGYLGDTQVNVVKIGMKNKLSELTDASGKNLGITGGQIFVYQDGTRSAININTDDTLETLAAKLSQYGITVGLSSEGKLYFDGNNNSYLTTDGIASSNASNILAKIGVAGNWSTRYDSTSKNLEYTETKNDKVNGSTKLKDLKDSSGNNFGITNGSYYVYSNGVRNTETINDNTTVNDFMSTLAKYGLVADFDENGSLKVGAYNNSYLATSALAGDNSNVVSALFEQWNFVNIYTSNNLDIPTDEVRAITKDTKLADINEGTYQNGLISVIRDGVKTNISLSADATVGTLMDELALYGFESVINSNGQLIIKNTGDSKLENCTGTGASNALELLGINLNSWINTNNYKSGSLSINGTTTASVNATRDTMLSELGVSTGEYYIYNNGVKYTAMISSDETLGSFMDTLKSFGLETSLVQGADGAVLKLVGKGDSYIKKSGSVTNSSNVVEKLFGNNIAETKEYSGLQQTSKVETTKPAATEETRLDYFGVTTGDVNVIVNGQSNIIKITADETIGSLIDKFNALGLNATLSSSGQIMVQSGYDTMTIATTGTTGTTSNVLGQLGLNYQNDLGGYSASGTVVNSTTSEIVEKTLSVANYANLNTNLGDLNISEGTLTIYRDGQKAQININRDKTTGKITDTFKTLQSKISTEFKNDNDVIVDFEDGKLKIYSKSGKRIEVGSTSDGSNFSAITGISTDENGVARSARELYCVNGDSVLTTSGIFRAGNVKAGTFTIGDAKFTIDNTTTLSNLVAQINSSEKANATAFWDNVDGKFVIKSKSTGSALVNIEAGTSNFTDILGLTSSTWNADGAINTTKMNIKTQEIGENAKVKINGTTYTSTSNTLDSDITRIKGLKINLKGLTKDEVVTIKVERDKETLANAVSSVVDSYNELMKNLDESMASDGDLRHESTLKLIRNQLRNLMTSSDAGTTVFKNLDSIGISVASASGSNIATSNSAIISMTFDKDKFFKAFEADQDAVKALLIGSANNKGIFSKLETEVESALAGVSGYFATTEASYKQKVRDLDTKIKKANKEVDRYKARLESKFQSMDMLIAQMQQQYSSFLKT